MDVLSGDRNKHYSSREKRKTVSAGNQVLRVRFIQSKQETHHSSVWFSLNQGLLEALPGSLPSSCVSDCSSAGDTLISGSSQISICLRFNACSWCRISLGPRSKMNYLILTSRADVSIQFRERRVSRSNTDVKRFSFHGGIWWGWGIRLLMWLVEFSGGPLLEQIHYV